MQETPPIYLDHNATTPVAPEVADAMDRVSRTRFGNPSSGHVYGRAAREVVERAREEVARLLGARPEEVLFTSGGTEANNLALLGVAVALGEELAGVVISAVEHPSVWEPAHRLAERGVALRIVGVGGDGRVDPAEVEQQVRELAGGGGRVLVSIMHANNETGAIQPVEEIAARIRSLGAILHADAAQSVGKIRVGMAELGVDLLTIAGHKFYGPKGVGALFVRSGTPISPVLWGAGHERGLRPGTENVAGLAGLAEATRLARIRVAEDMERIGRLRERLWEELKRRVPGLVRNGSLEHTLPNTLNVSFPEVAATELLEGCPGVAASTGSACHEGEAAPSRVLLAMGRPPETALGAVRLSLGRGTTEAEAERAAALLAEAWQRARSG
jgi:cysteine desulfurase